MFSTHYQLGFQWDAGQIFNFISQGQISVGAKNSLAPTAWRQCKWEQLSPLPPQWRRPCRAAGLAGRDQDSGGAHQTDEGGPTSTDRGAPSAARAAFFGASPVALRKPDGVIRPIEKYKKNAIVPSPILHL